jgi:hypothetical protein
MLSFLLTTALLGQLPTSPPDESDILRGAEQRPMIELLLDVSCSMGWSPAPTPCAEYATTYAGSPAFNTLNKNQMMEAALTGCRTPDDGIIDRWASRANFAVRFFGDSSGDGTSLEANWGTSSSDLQDAVRRASDIGNTPMSAGMVAAARDFSTQLTDGGGAGFSTLSCRRNFVLLLSDGEPNGGDATADSACNGVTDDIPAGEPWQAATYMMRQPDLMCRVSGNQQIGTYTIGFGRPGDFNPASLTQIAQEGDGRYYYATNVDSLNRAFEQIILSIAERGAVYGGGGTVQRQGLFSGNRNYLSSYRTVDGGSWIGNLKRICVTPRIQGRQPDGDVIYDTADRTCMLRAVADPDVRRTGRQMLIPNSAPRDEFTGTTSDRADVGGAAQLLQARIGAGIGARRYANAREVYTYFPEERGGYRRLDVDTLASGAYTDENLWISSGDTWKIVNRLNGFTYDNDISNGNPTALALGPLGDAVHGNPVLLRYSSTCANRNECFVTLPTNNGLVHFIDAATGAEASAVVPGELWRPSDLTHHQLADLERQPTFETNRRHYIDGPAQLFHRDRDGDGVIETGDSAYLVFGLGRGGRLYYLMDVSGGFAAGVPPPLYPLGGVLASAFEDLQDTWSSPWLGRITADTGGGVEPRNVAVFASGHITRFDVNDAPVPGRAPGRSSSSINRMPCAAVAALNGLNPSESCRVNVPGGFNPGLDIPVGPFRIDDAIRYRVRFRDFRLEPGDRMYITDGVERWANVLADRGTRSGIEPLSEGLDGGGWTNWIYGPEFFIRIVSDSGNDLDFEIDEVEFEEQVVGRDEPHFPTVYVAALDGARSWTDGGAFDANRSEDMVVAKLTRNCRGNTSNCVDAATSGAATADLAHMTCPVSSEVSVVSFNGELRLYWGDECGQIFVATNNDPGRSRRAWSVRRLAHMSWDASDAAPSMTNQDSRLGISRDVRKIFRRLDIVASTCPGRRVFGVYFGTGDVQRPLARSGAANAADAYLGDARLGSRDIMGVVYDDGVRGGLTTITTRTTGFYDVTAENAASRSDAPLGWYIRLGASEKMLRDPLVFQNVAYFKTFEPGAAATECAAGSGIDRVYAVNSCTAEAVFDTNPDGVLRPDDRLTSTGSEDIGPDPFIVTPPDAPPVVVASGPLGGSATQRGTFQRASHVRPRVYNWRLPR